jgi:hypothetical protein
MYYFLLFRSEFWDQSWRIDAFLDGGHDVAMHRFRSKQPCPFQHMRHCQISIRKHCLHQSVPKSILHRRFQRKRRHLSEELIASCSVGNQIDQRHRKTKSIVQLVQMEIRVRRVDSNAIVESHGQEHSSRNAFPLLCREKRTKKTSVRKSTHPSSTALERESTRVGASMR